MENSSSIIPPGIEGGTVNFTCPSNTIMSGGIINYGFSNRSINYKIPFGTTSLVINNATMGGDPAPGIQKRYSGSFNCAPAPVLYTGTGTISGPWIGTPGKAQYTIDINGTTYYILVEGTGNTSFVKFVSANGDAKYYVGKITDFDLSKWNTYSPIPKGNYIFTPSPTPAPAPTANNTDIRTANNSPQNIAMDFSGSNISQLEVINRKKNILNNIACINNTIIDDTNARQRLILQSCQLVKSPDGNNFIAVHSDGSISGYTSITSNNGATWIAKKILVITKSEMEVKNVLLPWNCSFDINDNSAIKLKDSSNNNSFTINNPTPSPVVKMNYSKEGTGLWDSNAAGIFTCPNVPSVIPALKTQYCAVTSEQDAINFCDSDSRCIGYVTNGPTAFQLLTKQPVANTGANGTYYKKGGVAPAPAPSQSPPPSQFSTTSQITKAVFPSAVLTIGPYANGQTLTLRGTVDIINSENSSSNSSVTGNTTNIERFSDNDNQIINQNDNTFYFILVAILVIMLLYYVFCNCDKDKYLYLN